MPEGVGRTSGFARRHVFDAVQRDWGGYSGYFADPDGFRWEIAYNPGPVGDSCSRDERARGAMAVGPEVTNSSVTMVR